jgi:prolyl-tRNA synthetase
MQKSLFDRALANREAHTVELTEYADLLSLLNGDLGFVLAGWCGSGECEAKVKEDTSATIRVIPDGPSPTGGCIVCGKDAVSRPVWARAY